MNENGSDSAEALDPRVQIELERLNTSTDEINKLEVELDEARLAFRRLLAEGHIRIQQLTRKLGTSVHKARPYYEARFRANITSQELQTAILAFDKANSAHTAAKEMVFLAEEGLSRLAEGSECGVTLDPAWQEMLNHATSRVNQVVQSLYQAEAERAVAMQSHRTRSAAHRAATTLVQQLQSNLKRHITKSRPYFEEKARINSALESQKAKIQSLEQQVAESKQKYSNALRNLERISDEIHRHRSRRQSTKNEIISPHSMESIAAYTSEHDLCSEENVREWLTSNGEESGPDNWTEVDLDYSSPEEVSFERCCVRTLSPSSPESPVASKVSTASPRRIIDRSPVTTAHLNKARRPSLDALLHDTGERVKEMFQGISLFSDRRGSESLPRTPLRSASPRSVAGSASDEAFSDTDSLASMEMLTDEQIASLMLDAQLESVCEKLAGVGLKRSPLSPNGHERF